MKELKIRVILEGDEIKTLMSRDGFSKDASGIIEVIGILDNLKQNELEKLKINKNVKITSHQVDIDDESRDRGFSII